MKDLQADGGGSTETVMMILTGNTLKTYGMKSADLQEGGGEEVGEGGGGKWGGVNVSRRSSGSASSPPSAR